MQEIPRERCIGAIMVIQTIAEISSFTIQLLLQHNDDNVRSVRGVGSVPLASWRRSISISRPTNDRIVNVIAPFSTTSRDGLMRSLLPLHSTFSRANLSEHQPIRLHQSTPHTTQHQNPTSNHSFQTPQFHPPPLPPLPAPPTHNNNHGFHLNPPHTPRSALEIHLQRPHSQNVQSRIRLQLSPPCAQRKQLARAIPPASPLLHPPRFLG